MASPRPSQWDQEHLFLTGDDYFANLLPAITQAKTTIDFETYIFEHGTLGERVCAALVSAAQRGVRVRLLIDGLGSPGFAVHYLRRFRDHKVIVRYFRVTPWVWQRLPGDARGLWGRWRERFRRVNQGNHRKSCLIDDTDLWISTCNVSDVHLTELSGTRAWKDLGIHVRGSEVKYARRAYKRAFRGWTALNWPARSPRLLLLNDSFLHKRRARREQLVRLRQAQRRIWLCTPYFVPVGRVFRLLLRQAKAGRDVRLMIPEKGDIWLMRWLALPLLVSLTKAGVKVFLFQNRFSHQKIFIVDDWISIGSSNLNHRSFLHDLEMDVVVTHSENKQALLNLYDRDLHQSRLFNIQEWAQLSWWQRGLASLVLVVKYWA